MAVAYETPGTLAYGTGNASAALPASIAAGDYLLLVIGNKPETVVPGFPEGVGIGWRLLGYQSGGGGTTGVDTGPASIAMFGRIADGNETGNVVSNLALNSVSWWQIYRFSNATGWWDVKADGGADSTTGTAWSVTVGSDIGITAGDLCLAASVIPTDIGAGAQFSSEAIAATGLTMGTMTERVEPNSGLGNDIGGFVFTQEVTSGTSSAAATITATAGGTTTNVRGVSLLVRLREAALPAVECVATAGATFVTSATNKTTSSFTVAVDDVIVVAVAGDEPADTFGTITNTGTAFTWTLEQSRQTGGAAVAPTYVWTTTATAAQSMTVNVVQTAGPVDSFWGIAVQVFRGGTLGTSALAFGTASAPSGSMTCEANAAVSVFLADEDGDLFVAPNTITAVGDMAQTTHYQNDPAWLNDMAWWHPNVGSSGSKTFGFSQGSLDWTLVTVEIVPATGNITASPSAIASLEAFGTAVITATLTASPTGIATAEAFGTAVISTPLTASPSGIASAEAFGTVTFTPGALTVSPGAIASAETFGTPTVALTLTVSPGAIGSAEAFGSPTITATLTASPTAIASAETFGTPAVSGALTVSPGGVASAEAFGTVEVSSLYAVHPDSITSSEAFGSPAVDIPITATPSGIATAEAFGTPEAQTGYTATPTGIASEETFGSPAVGSILTASPSGVGTSEAFGSPTIGTVYTATPDGIVSAEALGTPSVTIPITATPTGIGSAETFGTPVIALSLTVSPSGIAPVAAMGTPTISQSLLVSPGGIGTGEALGQPDVSLVLLVVVGGISSAEAFGTLEAAIGAHHPTITTTLGARNRYATGTPGNDPASLTISEDKANLGTKNRSGTNTPRERGAS